jgi:glycosyltransferase 2 family protein
MSVRVSRLLRAGVIAVIAVCLWWFVRTIDWAALGSALGQAKLWPLAIAALLNFACLYGKALCWHVMLSPKNPVRTRRLFRYTVAAFAASAIAPARAGEVLRIWVLKVRDNVAAADTAAVAIAEKLLDGMSMLVLVAPVPWLLPALPDWVTTSLEVCAAIAAVAFVGLTIAVGRMPEEGHRSWLVRFIRGMHVLRSPRRLSLSFVILIAVWLFDLGQVMLCLYAVGIDLPVPAALLILFTLNLTIVVPSTPAQVGALELGAVAALELLHVPNEPALAFALLYHAAQIVPLVVVGLALELQLVLGRVPVTAPAATAR